MKQLERHEVTDTHIGIINRALHKTLEDIKKQKGGVEMILSLEGNGHMEIFADNGEEFLRGIIIVYHNSEGEFKAGIIGVHIFDDAVEYALAADEKSEEENTIEVSSDNFGSMDVKAPNGELDAILQQAGIRREDDHE